MMAIRKIPGLRRSAKAGRSLIAQRDTKSVVWPFVALTTATVFLVFLALAGFHSLLVAGQFEVDRLQARLTGGRETAQILRMEVARLESPERILDVAQGRLGMVPPPQRVYLPAVVPGDPLQPIPAPIGNPFGTVRR